jgi:colanic acid biosynthesis glycosyl transferase WcaI
VARILIHTLVFSPDSVSTAYLMTDLAHQLRALGHSVSVLTTTPHYNLDPGALERQPLRRRWQGLLYESDCGGIKVWHVTTPRKGSRVGARILDYLRFHALSLVAGAFVTGGYDLVLAPSPPLSIGVVAWLLGRLRGAPAVYNVQEIYPDFAIKQGLLRSRTIISVLRSVERFVYRRSARVVVISEQFRLILRERGVPDAKLRVISNCVDTETYRPLPRRNRFSSSQGLDGSFVVYYGGNIGLSQDWESLLHAADALREKPISFLLTGDGVRQAWLEGEVERRRLPNVRLLGYQPLEVMPWVYASSDLGTIPMKEGTSVDTFPSKIYTMMACAKPVVISADAGSELARLVLEAGCGQVVAAGDRDAYTQAIARSFAERDRLADQGARGRAFVEGRYSNRATALAYNALVQEILGP